MYKLDLALKTYNGRYTIKPNQTKSCTFKMYREDLALSNRQWLMCHKNQPNYFIYI